MVKIQIIVRENPSKRPEKKVYCDSTYVMVSAQPVKAVSNQKITKYTKSLVLVNKLNHASIISYTKTLKLI